MQEKRNNLSLVVDLIEKNKKSPIDSHSLQFLTDNRRLTLVISSVLKGELCADGTETSSIFTEQLKNAMTSAIPSHLKESGWDDVMDAFKAIYPDAANLIREAYDIYFDGF